MKIHIKLKLWSSEIQCHIILHLVTNMIEEFTVLVYVSNFVYKVNSFALNADCMQLNSECENSHKHN